MNMKRTKDTEIKIEELTEFLNLFGKENDRGTALLAGSILEDLLGDILQSFLIDDKVTVDLLNEPNSPLNTFYSKARMSFASGLIDQEEYDEINIIRNIRNEFAHQWRKLTFDDESVTKYSQNLRKRLPYVNKNQNENRMRFIYSIVLLTLELITRKSWVIKEKRKVKEWPNKFKSNIHEA
jgi:mannitol operon repressor